MSWPRFIRLVDELAGLGGEVEVSSLSPSQCAEVVDACVLAERVCAALRLEAARVVARTGFYAEEGCASPEGWLSSRAGEPVGRARGELETAEALVGLPGLFGALRSGDVSAIEARVIAEAAGEDDKAAERLVRTARSGSHRRLRDEAERLKAARRSEQDETEAYAAIRRNRHVRFYRGSDGSSRGQFLLTPDAGARLMAALEPVANRLFDEVLSSGEEPERREAYLADALELLARGEAPAPTQLVCVVDLEALRRGEVHDTERCEIQGVGPVSVAVARQLFGDSLLRVVITDGVDVRTVVHHRRHLNAHLRTALDLRDPVCVVPECGSSLGLEYDHVQDFALGGPTSLENLVRLCHRHHKLKTMGRYRLEGQPGNYRWVKREPAVPRR